MELTSHSPVGDILGNIFCSVYNFFIGNLYYVNSLFLSLASQQLGNVRSLSLSLSLSLALSAASKLIEICQCGSSCRARVLCNWQGQETWNDNNMPSLNVWRNDILRHSGQDRTALRDQDANQ